MASVLSVSSRVDTQTIEHIEAVLWRRRQQDYALGPQAALSTVLAQRDPDYSNPDSGWWMSCLRGYGIESFVASKDIEPSRA